MKRRPVRVSRAAAFVAVLQAEARAIVAEVDAMRAGIALLHSERKDRHDRPRR